MLAVVIGGDEVRKVRIGTGRIAWNEVLKVRGLSLRGAIPCIRVMVYCS